MIKQACIIALLALTVSCKDEVLPKPPGYLSLKFVEPTYRTSQSSKVPFNFDYNFAAAQLSNINYKKNFEQLNFKISYPKLKADIFVNYTHFNKKELMGLIVNAQKITDKHVQVADEIKVKSYENNETRTYGNLYTVTGNAASTNQFYITDSINHFVTGSVYFRVKPNYDSILPAANYIRNDVIQLMKSLEWK